MQRKPYKVVIGFRFIVRDPAGHLKVVEETVSCDSSDTELQITTAINQRTEDYCDKGGGTFIRFLQKPPPQIISPRRIHIIPLRAQSPSSYAARP